MGQRRFPKFRDLKQQRLTNTFTLFFLNCSLIALIDRELEFECWWTGLYDEGGPFRDNRTSTSLSLLEEEPAKINALTTSAPPLPAPPRPPLHMV